MLFLLLISFGCDSAFLNWLKKLKTLTLSIWNFSFFNMYFVLVCQSHILYQLLFMFFLHHFHLVHLFFTASCRHSWEIAPESNSRETGMADFLEFSWSVVLFLRKATSTPILTERVRYFVLILGLDQVGV